MQCSKCGYIMGELDTDCLRCRRSGGAAPALATQAAPASAAPTSSAHGMREEEKECPRCGKATGAAAAVCDKCGYEYQPDSSRAERYQALLAEEARQTAPASALRRTVPPSLSWGIIAVCLLTIGGAGWAMFGGSSAGSDADSSMASPIFALHARKARPALRSVTYKVAGTAAQAVVTYRGADGAVVSPPDPVPLPWAGTVKLKSGSALSLTAKPADPTGTVAAEIDVDGAARKQATAPGADGATTVSDTL